MTSSRKYITTEERFELRFGSDFFFTKDLPVKWHCTYMRDYENDCKLAFSLLEYGAGVDKHRTKTIVEVTLISEEFHYDPPSFKAFVLDQDTLDPEKSTIVTMPIEPSWGFSYEIYVKVIVFVEDNRIPILAGYDFSDKNAANDKILVVEDKKFHVNKAVLSAYSPFFNNLFNNENFDESKLDEIELKELDPKEFEVLLQVIFPTNLAISADNAEFLWKLADRFGITSVSLICENFYCNVDAKLTGKMSIANRMKVAELYQSKKLLSILTNDMTKIANEDKEDNSMFE